MNIVTFWWFPNLTFNNLIDKYIINNISNDQNPASNFIETKNVLSIIFKLYINEIINIAK